MTDEYHLCETCKHFKGDAENCVDDITVAVSGIRVKCDGWQNRMKEEVR
jgi:hypothetical protein